MNNNEAARPLSIWIKNNPDKEILARYAIIWNSYQWQGICRQIDVRPSPLCLLCRHGGCRFYHFFDVFIILACGWKEHLSAIRQKADIALVGRVATRFEHHSQPPPHGCCCYYAARTIGMMVWTGMPVCWAYPTVIAVPPGLPS